MRVSVHVDLTEEGKVRDFFLNFPSNPARWSSAAQDTVERIYDLIDNFQKEQ